MSDLAYVVTLVTALGCGLVAGVFFAFSSFVMPALRRLPPAQGIAAMQSINVLAVTPAFMTAMFGTALACVVLIGWALFGGDDWPVGLVVAGGALYVVGTIGVTMAFNVPLNNGLAALRAEAPEAAGQWTDYLTTWTRWNSVRTVAGLVATALLAIALSD